MCALRRDVPRESQRVFDDICESVELLLRVTWLKRRDELIMQYNDFVPRTMSKERVKATYTEAPFWMDDDVEEIETKERQKSSESSKPVDKAEILEEKAFECGVAGPQEISLLKNLHILADHANFDRLGDDWIDKALSNPDRDGVCLKPVNRVISRLYKFGCARRSEGSKITTRQGLEKRLRDAYDLEIRAKDVDRETRFERVLAAVRFVLLYHANHKRIFDYNLQPTQVRRKGDPYMHLMVYWVVSATQSWSFSLSLYVEVAMHVSRIHTQTHIQIGGHVVACKTAAVAMIGAQTNIYGLALAGSVCAGVCFQTWVQFHMKRTQFNHTITKHLFQRKLAQNMITIESLIHETIEQEARELIIGLALLQQKNEDNAITSEMLKDEAESFLKKHFNISNVNLILTIVSTN